MGSLPVGYVEQTLKALGIEVTDHKRDELWALCPGHEERKGRKDTNPSWSINTRTGVFWCFSCKMKGNLYGLVLYLSGPDAAESVRRESGIEPAAVDVPKDGFRWVPNDKALSKFQVDDGPKTVAESSMALFTDPPDDALQARRLTRAAVDLHGVRWDNGSWILPLRRPDGLLLGWQVKGHTERVFRNQPRGIPVATTLFGLATAKGSEMAVLVESPLDAVMLTGMGYPAMALCGSRISGTQMELLGEFDLIAVALDADEAGEAEVQRLRRTEAWFRYVEVRYAGPGKDFGEMDEEVIRSSLEAVGFDQGE